MMNKILALDPSGTGTTGYFFTDEKDQREFNQFQSLNWLTHLEYLINLIKTKQPTILIYEHTNYIHKRNSDGLSLFKFLGAIEALRYIFPFLQAIHLVQVSQVKQCYTRLYENKEQLPNLTYKIGRGNGWKYHNQPLSRHQIDALLVYHLWKQNVQPPKSKHQRTK